MGMGHGKNLPLPNGHFPVLKLYIFKDFVKYSLKAPMRLSMFVILLSEL
jgi:hypothetical protein